MASRNLDGENVQGYKSEGLPSSQVCGEKKLPETSYHDNFDASPTTGVDTFHDSGFFEDEESNAHRPDYKDWVLFSGDASLPNLNEDSFFADLDASTRANHGSICEGRDNECTTSTAVHRLNSPQTRRTFYDPVHEAVNDLAHGAINEKVYEAINEYEVRSKPYYSNTFNESSYITPLEKWVTTFERHESVAYRLEQPPNPLQIFERLEIGQPSLQSDNRAHRQ